MSAHVERLLHAPTSMRVTGIDERNLLQQDPGNNCVVFIYEGGDDYPQGTWSVDSYLLTDADFTEVLDWLRENLPKQDTLDAEMNAT